MNGEFPNPYKCNVCSAKGAFCDVHEKQKIQEQEAAGVTTVSVTQEAPDAAA